MNKRIEIKCKGLFIKKASKNYVKVESLLFLKEAKFEGSVLNPIIIEKHLHYSFPSSEVTKILEKELPRDLFSIRECLENLEQEENNKFIYKGTTYYFSDKKLVKEL